MLLLVLSLTVIVENAFQCIVIKTYRWYNMFTTFLNKIYAIK